MAAMTIRVADTAHGVDVKVDGDAIPVKVGLDGARAPGETATLAQCVVLALLDTMRVNMGLELELTEEVVRDAA